MRFVFYGLLKAGFSRAALGRVLLRRYGTKCVGLTVDGVGRMHFTRYLFEGKDFGSYHFSSITFSDYSLIRTSFSRTPLQKVSLHASHVDDVALGADSLGKTVVASLRTVSLLPLLNIVVRSWGPSGFVHLRSGGGRHPIIVLWSQAGSV